MEVTDEMIRAAQVAMECDPAECDECLAKALTVVFASPVFQDQIENMKQEAYERGLEDGGA